MWSVFLKFLKKRWFECFILIYIFKWSIKIFTRRMFKNSFVNIPQIIRIQINFTRNHFYFTEININWLKYIFCKLFRVHVSMFRSKNVQIPIKNNNVRVNKNLCQINLYRYLHVVLIWSALQEQFFIRKNYSICHLLIIDISIIQL